MMQHNKSQVHMAFDLTRRFFTYVPYISLCEIREPCGSTKFPIGCNLNKLGRIPVGEDIKYQGCIPFGFRQEDCIVCLPCISLCQ